MIAMIPEISCLSFIVGTSLISIFNAVLRQRWEEKKVKEEQEKFAVHHGVLWSETGFP